MAVPSHSIGISADHACLLAALAWGGGMAPTDWDRLAPALRDRMMPDGEFLIESRLPPSAAQSNLLQGLQAQRRVDLTRVHRSWRGCVTVWSGSGSRVRVGACLR